MLTTTVGRITIASDDGNPCAVYIQKHIKLFGIIPIYSYYESDEINGEDEPEQTDAKTIDDVKPVGTELPTTICSKKKNKKNTIGFKINENGTTK
jgi:hypothetical protein